MFSFNDQCHFPMTTWNVFFFFSKFCWNMTSLNGILLSIFTHLSSSLFSKHCLLILMAVVTEPLSMLLCSSFLEMCHMIPYIRSSRLIWINKISSFNFAWNVFESDGFVYQNCFCHFFPKISIRKYNHGGDAISKLIFFFASNLPSFWVFELDSMNSLLYYIVFVT